MTTAPHRRLSAAPRARNRSVYHPARAPRALIVAKDQRFRRWARGQLRAGGFKLLVADDGFGAVKTIDDDPPEIVVVDHGVPWFGVLGLLSRVRRDAALDTIPVLLVARRATGAFVEACRALGVAVLVRRPGERKAELHVHVPGPRTLPRRVEAEAGDPSYERSR